MPARGPVVAAHVHVFFCDWGSAVFTKVRPLSDERLNAELKWFGKNQIELLYNCDANYGPLDRDLSLTQTNVAINAYR